MGSNTAGTSKALKPGNYRLVTVAVDAAGNKSKKLSRPLRIVR